MPSKTMKKTTTATEAVAETPSTPVENTKRVFKADDGILCRSVTQGKLFVNGIKTGMKYMFYDYDGEAEIEYRDLVALIRARDKSVFNPRFIILDEDFIEEFPTIKKFYDDHFSTTNIAEILDMPEYQMVQEINKLPKSAVDSLKFIAANKVSTGEIDSLRKIKALDEVFGTDLSLLNELFSN